MFISNRIKKLRLSSGMDRYELAKGIISYSHLSNIESGRFEPSEEILILLAKRLKVPKEYLTKYKEKDNHLDELLIKIKFSVDNLALSNSLEIITEIKNKYPFITSIYQETFYKLLLSYFYYKEEKINHALDVFNNEVLTLLENVNIEGLSTDFKEIYYYLNGLNLYFQENYHLSYKYFILYLTLINTNLKRGIAYFNIALVLIKLDNYQSALTYAKKSLDIYLHERIWYKAADADNLLGVINLGNNEHEAAEKHLLNALDISEQYNLESLKPRVLHNLGLLYKKNRMFEKSLEYFYKVLKFEKELRKKNSLIKVYYLILTIYIEQEKYENAMSLLNKVNKENIIELDRYHLKIIEARINLHLKNSNEYERLMKEIIDFFSENKQWKNIINLADELGEYYSSKKKYKQSSIFYKKAIAASKKNIN